MYIKMSNTGDQHPISSELNIQDKSYINGDYT